MALSAKFLLIPLLFLGACQARIGTDCKIDRDCSQAGTRLCDITQPEGYCTIFNCTPTNCPHDGSICVQFNSELSPVKGCQNPNQASPYTRNFCMQTCESDSDCREHYECRDVGKENPWGAAVVQSKAERTTICVAKLTSVPASDAPVDNGVCVGAPGGAGGMSSGGGAGGAN